MVSNKPGLGTTATAAEKAKIKELREQGLGRNAIAREIGRSWQWTTAVANSMGITFDPTQTKVATAVWQANSKERLAALAVRMIDHSEVLMTRLESETYQYTVVVPGKGPTKVTEAAPPAIDEKNLSMSQATYLKEATRLIDRADDSSVQKVKSMIEKMGEALGLTDG